MCVRCTVDSYITETVRVKQTTDKKIKKDDTDVMQGDLDDELKQTKQISFVNLKANNEYDIKRVCIVWIVLFWFYEQFFRLIIGEPFWIRIEVWLSVKWE